MANPKITTLESGLRIITDESTEVSTVSIGVWCGIGGRYETKENNGISHVLEHMAFKGTKTRTTKDLSDIIENVGGRVNAYTGREMTCYYVKMLAEHTDIGIDFLSDILQNSTFPEAELEREKSVIIQEINMYLDQPDDLATDYFYEMAFKDQPLGMTIIGPEENIKRMTREDLFDYMQNGYAFDRMIVSAAGKIDHEEFVKKIEDKLTAFSKIQKTKAEKGVYTGGTKICAKKIEQANIVYGLPGISFSDPDYYAARVYRMILDGGMSARLFQEVREKRGLAYAVSAFHSMHDETGVFGVYTGTSPDKAEEALKVVKEELQKMTGPIADEELDRAKSIAKAGLLFGQESMMNRAETNARQILLFGKLVSADEISREIERIKEADIQRFAKRILSGPETLSVVAPEGSVKA